MNKLILTTGLLLSLTTPVFAANTLNVKTTAGNVLADSKGMTLYTFKKDKKDTSNCYDKCAVAWPPFYVNEGEVAKGDFAPIKRKDGKMQWAFKNQPLYYFIKDKKKADIKGDKLKGVWFVIKQ